MMKKKIAIIDYQLGNLFSVQQACLHIGYEADIVSTPEQLINADYAILPGVGAFRDAMKNMEKLDMITPLKDFIASGKPFMGICLGLQLLFSESEEFGITKGLGIIKGSIKKFPASLPEDGYAVKVPQIAWNQIHAVDEKKWESSPLHTCSSLDYMYFVHSFYAVPESADVILSSTEYAGIQYCSSLLKDNVFACQFHPEKSGIPGVEIYKNWLIHNY
jgi:glutamine amidotransferase